MRNLPFFFVATMSEPLSADFTDADADAARRFGGLDRLYGDGARQALARLRVVVAGIGGVGAWCAE
ncbi:MAG: tRNA threonylcarbamoyladenosine dehydratase, partial [Burkholderiales bacterium]|nr:tRNA threonylcarbamoyladenosine dehydratase [Burkholderiales bacterium]